KLIVLLRFSCQVDQQCLHPAPVLGFKVVSLLSTQKKDRALQLLHFSQQCARLRRSLLFATAESVKVGNLCQATVCSAWGGVYAESAISVVVQHCPLGRQSALVAIPALCTLAGIHECLQHGYASVLVTITGA